MGDNWLIDVTLGVLANGVTAAIARAGPAVSDRGQTESAVAKALRTSTAWATTLDKIQADHRSTDEVAAFISSAEFAQIVRELAHTSIACGGISPDHRLLVQRHVEALLALQASDLPPETVSSLAGGLSEALLTAVEAVTTKAPKGTRLARLLRPDPRPEVVLQQQLSAIQKTLDFLAAKDAVSYADLIQYESALRRLVRQRHGSIHPPHVSVSRRIPIDDLYVVPGFLSGLSDVPRWK